MKNQKLKWIRKPKIKIIEQDLSKEPKIIYLADSIISLITFFEVKEKGFKYKFFKKSCLNDYEETATKCVLHKNINNLNDDKKYLVYDLVNTFDSGLQIWDNCYYLKISEDFLYQDQYLTGKEIKNLVNNPDSDYLSPNTKQWYKKDRDELNQELLNVLHQHLVFLDLKLNIRYKEFLQYNSSTHKEFNKIIKDQRIGKKIIMLLPEEKKFWKFFFVFDKEWKRIVQKYVYLPHNKIQKSKKYLLYDLLDLDRIYKYEIMFQWYENLCSQMCQVLERSFSFQYTMQNNNSFSTKYLFADSRITGAQLISYINKNNKDKLKKYKSTNPDKLFLKSQKEIAKLLNKFLDKNLIVKN